METRKLLTMTDFVKEILDYVDESQNYQRGIDLIRNYHELIKQPLTMDMFAGEKSLFPSFHVVENIAAATSGECKQAIFPFGSGIGATLYRKAPDNIKSKTGMCYTTSFNLKTVEDLCGKDILYNVNSEYSEINVDIN